MPIAVWSLVTLALYILAGTILFCTIAMLATLISYDQIRRKQDRKEFSELDILAGELKSAHQEMEQVADMHEDLLQSILQQAETGEGNLEILDEIVAKLAGDDYDNWVELSTIAGLDWPKRAEIVQLGAVPED